MKKIRILVLTIILASVPILFVGYDKHVKDNIITAFRGMSEFSKPSVTNFDFENIGWFEYEMKIYTGERQAKLNDSTRVACRTLPQIDDE